MIKTHFGESNPYLDLWDHRTTGGEHTDMMIGWQHITPPMQTGESLGRAVKTGEDAIHRPGGQWNQTFWDRLHYPPARIRIRLLLRQLREGE